MSAYTSFCNDLTFLLQGKSTKETNFSIKIIRERFPGCKVILSCWEGDERIVTEFVDKMVCNIDPVVYPMKEYKLDNINRQIVSTKNGLEHVKTKYVCKLRTDSYLDNSDILSLYKRYNNSGEGVFTEKVLVTNLTTINPKKMKHSFHVCDWIYLGLTSDVKSIFSLEIKPRQYFYYFDGKSNLDDSICSQHRAETALFEHFFPNERFEYNNTYETNSKTIDLTLNLFRYDLIIVNPWMIGLKSFKHHYIWLWINSSRFTYNDWLILTGQHKNYIELIKECFTISISKALSKVIVIKKRIKSKW